MTSSTDYLRPDRAIASLQEDKLNRSGFVRRLSQALVSPNNKRATGLVIGVSGPWGSGKSSILNLVEEEIKNTHPQVVTVRFDPWLVSGREDLLAQFFSEIIKGIRRIHPHKTVFDSRKDQILDEVLNLLDQYGAELSRLAGLVKPGLGFVGDLLLSRVGSRLREKGDLGFQRKRLADALKAAGISIVVLVDELDRIEDSEIRTMAQLVRAIADFPQISYLLAYDGMRVAEALGRIDLDIPNPQERGRAYLEKIVHMQLDMPVLERDEIGQMLSSEILESLRTIDPATYELEIERFEVFKNIVTQTALTTARDIKRVAQHFHARYLMVAGEVEWVDVLGMSLIDLKLPHTGRVIRANYDSLVYDGLDSINQIVRWREDPRQQDEQIRILFPDIESNPWLVQLLKFLFGSLGSLPSSEYRVTGNIAFRIPLLTLLRLGLLPGYFARGLFDKLASQPASAAKEEIKTIFLAENFPIFAQRLADLTVSHPTEYRKLWWFMIEGAEEAIPADIEQTIIWRKNAQYIPGMLDTSLGQESYVPDNESSLRNLIEQGARHIPCDILYTSFFTHGLFGKEYRPANRAAISKERASELGKFLSGIMSKDAESPEFFESSPDPLFMYFLQCTGLWSDRHAAILQSLLRNSGSFLDRFIVWMFGDYFSTDLSGLGILVDMKELSELARNRTTSKDDDEGRQTILVAYEKFFRQLRRNADDTTG